MNINRYLMLFVFGAAACLVTFFSWLQTQTGPGSELSTEKAPFRQTTSHTGGMDGSTPPDARIGSGKMFQLGSDRARSATRIASTIKNIFTEPVGAAKTSETGLIDNERDDDAPRPDQPDEAMKFRLMQLRDENGKIPIDGLIKARQQMKAMQKAQEKRAALAGKSSDMKIAGLSPSSWTWLGPGNIGGRIRSIVIDPNNANSMWVGSVGGGIWHSTDAGATWHIVDDFMANLAVSTMVIDPTNSSILYAGTGEGFGNFDALQGGGIFKSTDGGVSWNQIASTNPAAPAPALCGVGNTPCPSFWSFVDRLAIASDSSSILAATKNGIARSTDGGVTWTQTPGYNSTVVDVKFRPGDPTQALAGGLGVILSSTDGGQNWASLPQASFDFPLTNGGNSATNGRVELAYASNGTPQTVYAAVNDNNGQIYKSIDGGTTFKRVNNGTNFFVSSPTSTNNQGWYDNTIWVNPLNSSVVVVGGIDLWRSTDGGSNFTQISRWQSAPQSSAHADHHVIVASPNFDNNTNKTVFFGNDGGLYKTDDISMVAQTSGWQSLNNFLGITQYIGSAATDGDTIVAGAQDNGTDRLTANAGTESWTELNLNGGNGSGDGSYSAFDAANSIIYGEQSGMRIHRTLDGVNAGFIYCAPANIGSNGACTSGGISESNNGANFAAPIALDPSDPKTILAGGLSLWRTNDANNTDPTQNGGLPTWTTIKAPVSNGLIPPSNVPISAVTVSPSDSNFILVGYNNGRIYLTFDGTSASPTWSRIDLASMPARFVTRLVVDDTKSPNWIYATFGGFSADNIYRTTDLGATWTDVTGSGMTGLPNVPVRALVINPVRREFLYVGTEIGIFASEDAGATWQVPTGGPANVSVEDLVFQKGDLVASTHGRGLYTTHTGVIDVPSCTASAGCPCAGRTDCPCSWPKNQLPGPDDDVDIACPMSGPGFIARNVRIDSRLDLENGSINTAGDVINNGLIDTLPGWTGSIFANNIVMTRPPHAVTERGIIDLNGNIFATGDIDDGGIIGVSGEVSANNLTVAASDGFAGPNASLSANFIDVKGDIFNNGTITTSGSDGGISIGNPAQGIVHKLSGTGTWQFSGLFGLGNTVSLLNDLILNGGRVALGNGTVLKLQNHNLTFNGTSFDNGNAVGDNATIDVGTGSLIFNGTDHFYASSADAVGNTIGSVVGTGSVILQPADGSADFRNNVNGHLFQPVLEVKSGTIDAQAVYTDSNLVVNTGARLNLNGGTSTVQGDVMVGGILGKATVGLNTIFNFNGQNFTNNGSFLVDTLQFNSSGVPLAQNLSGTGVWPSSTKISFGTVGSPSNVTLMNDITVNPDRLSVVRDSSLDLQNHTLTYGGLDASPLNILGTGTFKMAPAVGPANIEGTINSALRIANGTVSAGALTANGTFNVDAGAILAISTNSGSIASAGNVTIDGTLNGNGRSFALNGDNSFTNNGVVDSTFLTFGSGGGATKNQRLGGSGTWTSPSGWIFVGSESTTTLTSDLTYTGPQLFIDGKLSTGAFTLTLPCPATWQGAGDIVGNIRRTNLGACATPIAFGNPFTTIKFNSGTPPTEVTVHVALSPPLGFPNAVARSYTIDAVGGGPWVATLRLHYLDSELNGNDENGLVLFRNDGTAWNVIGVTASNTTNNWVEYAGVTQFSPWTLASSLPNDPTAAPVMVSGRVVSAAGIGISNARITMVSQGGVTRTALTNPFGYYQIFGVPSGETYIMSVSSKGHTFSQSSRLINVNDAISDADFIADN